MGCTLDILWGQFLVHPCLEACLALHGDDGTNQGPNGEAGAVVRGLDGKQGLLELPYRNYLTQPVGRRVLGEDTSAKF